MLLSIRECSSIMHGTGAHTYHSTVTDKLQLYSVVENRHEYPPGVPCGHFSGPCGHFLGPGDEIKYILHVKVYTYCKVIKY